MSKLRKKTVTTFFFHHINLQ